MCVETKAGFPKPSSKTVATRSSSSWTDALMKWGRPEERDILATPDDDCDDGGDVDLTYDGTRLFESNASQFPVMTMIKVAIPVSLPNPATLFAPPIPSILSLRDTPPPKMMICTSSGNPTQPLLASMASTHEPVGNDAQKAQTDPRTAIFLSSQFFYCYLPPY
ncbi:unnamed protein product [Tuber melanosporum]|uniref:(Perigord truffle) hypothetical protein n=1 Tax=Tuber melanosporum (strain Mel28) TaxID=656061 RepID=D5GP70_TUBMM|nr:uncharacterized protein GSTUM_00011733001 [Tuber melanosporum]CAZ86335.1 unnamed protein product [Tuber melanosporum]